ncbi:fimbrial protein [Haemophilus influenzae]|uniref:fimbrial protein n=1 Tax=Haemophilus influenzae TaxID=727 RepID=UPI000E3311BD|nr:fimbrial protein [Haemophilus influenzae]AXP42100.1 type 1 fimbrial protein [Haemophilus influenzae]AXP58433.1 type 1 fimbrial protein [Haemophilus influenzae]MCK9000834.1 type 1 fimbrial protein [Haemophilus influenzae]MCK9009194.1 type 1 fimbrial protein [Haemophilus influenzae]MCK9010893.1 type 1 fimbrial protein [Haemophilus influenzae]
MQKTPKKLTALFHQKSTATCSGANYSGANYSGSKCFRFHRLALLACVALLDCIVALPAYAYDGRVTFQGEILSDGTCKIETDSQNRTVTLPTVGKANLSHAGQTAAPVPFSITLKECNADDAMKANLLFKGGDNTTGQSYLSNKAGNGKATNVGIQIVKADGIGTPIKVDGTEANSEKAPDTGKAQNGTVIQPRFDYFARYYATGEATAGDVEATATFEVQYN